MTQQTSFDFPASETGKGFRLHRFEVLNWGTFDRSVWIFPVEGENALLTGNIGSGKSTLADGVTTLLVPSHRIVFNKAAGAEGRERTLASYVRGHYKSEKDDASLSARAVALRDRHTYSVLLGYFYCEELGLGVTLAQVFWMLDHQQKPDRLFVVMDGDLAIAEDFAAFGSEIKDLKRQLKRKGALLCDAYSEYASEFRRRFGIQSEQALDLFYQTVSMKSVGNLTEFVRQHMLDAPPAEEWLEQILRDFDNVNRAYEAVLKAKDQVAALTPMIADGDRLQTLTAEQRDLIDCREALYAYFARHKVSLLEERLGKLDREVAKLEAQLQELAQALAHLERQRSDLRRSIEDQGGRRLEEIRSEVARLGEERARIAKAAEEFRQRCTRLELPFPTELDAFQSLITEIAALGRSLDDARTRLDEDIINQRLELKRLLDEHERLAEELQSLKERRSNIPLDGLRLRQRMCEALGLEEEVLPFAGELIRVAEEEPLWEGALERLLNAFGRSLLVSESLYARVSQYVERTQLRGKLVYYRVPAQAPARPRWPDDPRSLVHKLRLRTDHAFHPWIEAELCRRFDIVCTEDLEEFRRLPVAMTPQGQTKFGGVKHEKDDRFRIDDRSRYVLGWSNQEKVRALEGLRQGVAHQGDAARERLASLDTRVQDVHERRDAVRDLGRFAEYREIDWAPVAGRIQALNEEKRRLETESDVLRVLEAKLLEVEAHLKGVIDQERAVQRELGAKEEKRATSQDLLAAAIEHMASLPPERQARLFPRLEEIEREALGGKRLVVENCDSSQTQTREWLKGPIDRLDKAITRSREAIIGTMKDYNHRFPQETSEVDASLDALDAYREMLHKLRREDLPRHERKFKELLNERTIQGIAMFKNALDKEAKQIEGKIATINRSLRDIDYNPGTYIALMGDRTQDAEIRDFQRELRDCLGGILEDDEDELYAEHKFLEVKRIIDRFKGRAGLTELDRRWTQKVTDVRNWFVFSASERWSADDTQKEYYSDSSGKSGGQKEKLAYTILASALAYQLGGAGEPRARSFRFVMIDEAFGRGSDDSARYGLELFKRLDLQLLVVTPFQKIHVIEDYVRSVHVIQNPEGRTSSAVTLSIAEYHAQKAQLATTLT